MLEHVPKDPCRHRLGSWCRISIGLAFDGAKVIIASGDEELAGFASFLGHLVGAELK